MFLLLSVISKFAAWDKHSPGLVLETKSFTVNAMIGFIQVFSVAQAKHSWNLKNQKLHFWDHHLIIIFWLCKIISVVSNLLSFSLSFPLSSPPSPHSPPKYLSGKHMRDTVILSLTNSCRTWTKLLFPTLIIPCSCTSFYFYFPGINF